MSIYSHDYFTSIEKKKKSVDISCLWKRILHLTEYPIVLINNEMNPYCTYSLSVPYLEVQWHQYWRLLWYGWSCQQQKLKIRQIRSKLNKHPGLVPYKLAIISDHESCLPLKVLPPGCYHRKQQQAIPISTGDGSRCHSWKWQFLAAHHTSQTLTFRNVVNRSQPIAKYPPERQENHPK